MTTPNDAMIRTVYDYRRRGGQDESNSETCFARHNLLLLHHDPRSSRKTRIWTTCTC